MTRKLFVPCVMLLMVGAASVGAYLGHRVGRFEAFHEFVGIQDAHERRAGAIGYALGLEEFKGVTGQDLWVLHSVHPGIKDGYFVDLGSADGVTISNTWALERNGWTGICIDPF